MTISPFSSSAARRQGTPPAAASRCQGVKVGSVTLASSTHTSPAIQGSG